jgi:hypothetical protein
MTRSVTNPYDLSYEDDSSVDPEGAVDEDVIMDANIYEALSRSQDPVLASNSVAQAPSAESQPPLLSPSEQPNVPDHPDYGIAADCEASTLIVDPFPSRDAGAPITDSLSSHLDPGSTQELLRHNIWAPFRSQCDWEFAHWAKTHGTTSSAVNELLAIPEVHIPEILLFQSTYTLYKLVEKIGLSYCNVKGLNKIIDQELPGRPTFKCMDIEVGEQTHDLYYREIIPCIRSLYGDPEFLDDLVFAPERHYTDADRTCRVFSEMHTGNWWWSVQVREIRKSKL